MNSFNLDIDSYTNNELEELLNLSKPYSINDIENNKSSLIIKLNNNDKHSLSNDKKYELDMFLNNVASKLRNNAQEDTNNLFLKQKNEIQEEGSNMLITNPNTIQGQKAKSWNGRLTDTPEQPPGYINPINIKTIKRAINIDSRFRQNYYATKSTNYSINLPESINKVVSMRIASIEIPLTYYALSKSLGNTTFVVEDVSNSILWKAVVQDGNYELSFSKSSNAALIENGINEALRGAIAIDSSGNPISTSLNPPGGSTDGTIAPYLVFRVDRASGKSVFASPAGTLPRDFKIYFDVNTRGVISPDTPVMFRLGWQLGYRASQYIGQSVISEGICFISGPRYIFLAIKDYQNSANNYFSAAFAESSLSPDIIARINLSVLLENNGVYKSGQDDGFSTQVNRTREYFGPVDINKLELVLYDEFGRILDLNNMDWSLALAFECIYD